MGGNLEAPEAFRKRKSRPWHHGKGVSAVLKAWSGDNGVRHSTVLNHTLDAKEGRFAPVPEQLSPQVAKALKDRGIEQLYAHQAEAFVEASKGRHIVVATPTASGKSLCYNLPVLDALAREPAARALYLFPTKALSRDQEEAVKGLMRSAGIDHGAITYDGDTPGDARRAARERSGVLLTNPDMLHAGILPHHANWARLFSNLRYVVIDELHMYRGVFGSHLANVVRRLLRVARFHGSNPVLIFASATIGNPQEHAARMVGEDVSLIGESGAPAGPRHVVVYNPPVVNAELGIRASYLKSSVKLACDLVRAEVPTLVFGQSRNHVEVMLKYLRDRLAADKVDPATIMAYRGGYLPDTRRRIEAGLRAGDIRCVVATNALELGIDIGCLDAVVCAGYPGSVAGLWQRFGRAGRRLDGSVAVLVTSSSPLDQYMAADPQGLISAPVEQARIDPDNVEVLVQHLKCAAFELPFEEGEPFGNVSVEETGEALEFLASHDLVHPVPGSTGKRVYHWAADAYPANHVSLRSVGWDNFVVIDEEHDRTIAEMDFRSTHTMLHVQAIYQHEGQQYQVERLDYENHKAYVRKVKPDYFTDAMTYTRVEVLHEEDGARVTGGSEPTPDKPGFSAGVGEVSVIEKVVGYKKIKYHTHENVGYGDVRLPEIQMHTTALWLIVPEQVVVQMPYERPTVLDALRGVGSALHTVAAVGLMIDPRDLGRATGDRTDPDAPPSKGGGGGPGFDPTVFLYDHVPGGIGLAPRLYEVRDDLVRRARRLIEECRCGDGCPACVGPAVGVGLPNAPGAELPPDLDISRRRVALELLEALGIAATH